ncbi:MAG: HAD family phosphatase [Actinomycetota bacterium]|nr:HAD family phosphatase [Actinomycetota bacterium]
MTTHFDALIVDYGGVLTTSMQEGLTRFSEELGIELQDLVRAVLPLYSGGEDELVSKYEMGQITDEEFSRALAERLSSVTGEPVDPERLVNRMFAGMNLEESMLDAVGAARRAGIKTALLSNSWGLSLYPRERFGDLFDVIVISGEVGLRKPDEAIFTLTTDRLGVAPEACVFVDDHPGHLQGAMAVGMTTVLHRSPSQTRAELSALLNLPLP